MSLVLSNAFSELSCNNLLSGPLVVVAYCCCFWHSSAMGLGGRGAHIVCEGITTTHPSFPLCHSSSSLKH